MADIRARAIEMYGNCRKIHEMRNDRATNVCELDNLYENTVKLVIDILPSLAFNMWLDNRASDIEFISALNVDREYAEEFIEVTGEAEYDD